MAKPNYWLIKSEPDVYGYEKLEQDGRTDWTGIRNFAARNNLRAMKPGDLCLYYHTGDEKAVVGIAKVLSEARADPTAPGEDWSMVEVAPMKRLARPVTLVEVKGEKALKAFPLVTHGRLSVAPVTPAHFELIVSLSNASGAESRRSEKQAAAKPRTKAKGSKRSSRSRAAKKK